MNYEIVEFPEFKEYEKNGREKLNSSGIIEQNSY